MSKNFYITTTLPYVNAPLHLGHATEIIRADAIARYKELMGFDVFFNTGTDEHGMKIYESAEKEGKPVQGYVDHFASLYKKTLVSFGVLEDAHYIRTTDLNHIEAAKAFWRRCNENGFIYKKNYEAKYCVSCEEEKTDSELVDGKCPIHNRPVDIINEENYFFKLSSFEEKLLTYYEKNPDFIIPSHRMNEMREFIKRGLRDFSISRLKSKMPWGIEVPEDPTHVMYVWFDALVNYISTLGWPKTCFEKTCSAEHSRCECFRPSEEDLFTKFWVNGKTVQYCGKDNTRFQGVMWQAMLMAANIPQTDTIIVDGFILGEGGVKMSKTLGNTIDPLDIVSEYGIDALRYFVLREFHPFEDTAVSKDKLKESFNANLANGIGNLTSRIMKMAETNLDGAVEIELNTIPENWKEAFESFDIQKVCDITWSHIQALDKMIQVEEPFKLVKSDPEKGKEVITTLVKGLYTIARMLNPILPETSVKIKELVKENKSPAVALFLRK